MNHYLSSNLYFLLPNENSRNTDNADWESLWGQVQCSNVNCLPFAQEENINYFKTTEWHSAEDPTPRGCYNCPKKGCLVTSGENRFLTCSELSRPFHPYLKGFNHTKFLKPAAAASSLLHSCQLLMGKNHKQQRQNQIPAGK